MNSSRNFRLIFNHPTEFGSRKISRGIEQMWQAIVLTKGLESFFSKRYCPAVAPNDGGTKYLLSLVHTNEPMHLVGYAYPFQLTFLNLCLLLHKGNPLLDIGPPKFRVLFGPSCLGRMNGHFYFRETFGCEGLTRICI